MGEDDIRLLTFGDAVAEGFALADQFRRAHTAVVVDGEGRVLDMTVFTLPEHTPDMALAWASAVPADGAEPTRVFLFSVVASGVETVREADISRFICAEEDFASRGWQLVDHILCDGENMRSLAFTTGAGTWDEDGSPVDVRLR